MCYDVFIGSDVNVYILFSKLKVCILFIKFVWFGYKVINVIRKYSYFIIIIFFGVSFVKSFVR